MTDLCVKLATRLKLPTDAVHMTRLGLYASGYLVTPSNIGVVVKHPKVQESAHDYCDINRALLVRLMSDKEAMRYSIDNYVATVINRVSESCIMINELIVEGERVIVTTTDGERWRINMVTYNVTKYQNDAWIIQNKKTYTNKLMIDRVASILIQVGMFEV